MIRTISGPSTVDHSISCILNYCLAYVTLLFDQLRIFQRFMQLSKLQESSDLNQIYVSDPPIV